MKTITRLLCIIIVTVSGCNTNGNHPAGKNDAATSSISADNTVKTDTMPTADSVLRANFSLVRVDNLACPVCRKPLVNCVEDTTSYLGKLIGFDSRQCGTEFAKNPGAYRIDYK